VAKYVQIGSQVNVAFIYDLAPLSSVGGEWPFLLVLHRQALVTIWNLPSSYSGGKFSPFQTT
jgi:hypothetical protein